MQSLLKDFKKQIAFQTNLNFTHTKTYKKLNPN